MWLEGELGKKNLEPDRRAALEALGEKGMNGQLKDSDLVKFRRQAGPMVAGMNPYPLADVPQLRGQISGFPKDSSI